MTIAQRVGAISASLETKSRANEFLQVARIRMISDNPLEAKEWAKLQRVTDRVLESLTTRAAASAGNITDSTWASPLAPYSLLMDAFMETLRNVSAFDAILPNMLRVPPLTTVAVTTAGASGLQVHEGNVKPATRISFSSINVTPTKSIAFVVVSAELMKAGGPGALALLGRELRGAVAHVTDEVFISALLTGLTAIPSVGATALAIRNGDLRALMDSVSSGSGSALYFLTTPQIAKRLSVIATSDGARAFPGATPIGGELDGTPLVVSDAVDSGVLILLDASQIAATSGAIELGRSTAATLQLDDNPGSPPVASALYRSLWAENLAALKAERVFGISRGRASAVAYVEGFTGIGNSPN